MDSEGVWSEGIGGDRWLGVRRTRRRGIQGEKITKVVPLMEDGCSDLGIKLGFREMCTLILAAELQLSRIHNTVLEIE